MSFVITAFVSVLLYLILSRLVHPFSAAGLALIVFSTGAWSIIRFSAWQLYHDCMGTYFKARAAGRSHPQAIHEVIANRYLVIHRAYRKEVEGRFKGARASLMDDRIFASDASELQALLYVIYTTEKGVPKEQPMVHMVKGEIEKLYQQYRQKYPKVWMDIMSEEEENRQ